MCFSKRMGLETKKTLQIDSMDDELKTGLHNAIRAFESHSDSALTISLISFLYQSLWIDFLILDKDLIDSILYDETINYVKQYYIKLPWNKVYEYLEHYYGFLFNHCEDFYCPNLDLFEALINQEMEKHNSAYRLKAGKFIPITSEKELEAIDEAASTESNAINTHINNAIKEFSNKKQMDYRIVIHESISAVESAVNYVLKDKYQTLGQALDELDKRYKMHPALKGAFEKMYGYTSSKDTGIRHGLCDDAKHPPGFEEAKYMLVSCSAFVNYLLQKYQT